VTDVASGGGRPHGHGASVSVRQQSWGLALWAAAMVATDWLALWAAAMVATLR
jgi:hypothetical protein